MVPFNDQSAEVWKADVLPMIAYGFIGCGLLIALLSGGLWMQTERLDVAHGQIENCEKEKEILAKSLITQNRAVKGWQDTAEKRGKQAKAALAKAQTDGQARDAEIARLKRSKPLSCPDAVAEVKKGLKP